MGRPILLTRATETLSAAADCYMDQMLPDLEKALCSDCPYAKWTPPVWDDYSGGTPPEFSCGRDAEFGDENCYYSDEIGEIEDKLREADQLCRNLR